jgi:hypothetical protein
MYTLKASSNDNLMLISGETGCLEIVWPKGGYSTIHTGYESTLMLCHRVCELLSYDGTRALLGEAGCKLSKKRNKTRGFSDSETTVLQMCQIHAMHIIHEHFIKIY